jgi:hypothetical protein
MVFGQKRKPLMKAIDLRLKGVSFEDAVKRILAAPPMPKKSKRKPVAKAVKNLRLN